MNEYSTPNRRQILTGLLATAATPALANAPTSSRYPQYRTAKARLSGAGDVDQLIEKGKLSGALGFVVMDADTGLILEQRKPLLSMPPASVAKTLTALYAIQNLGAEHRFTTRVLHSGKISDGVLIGDLYLLGSGDPSLDTDALGDMAQALVDQGIKKVSGKTYVHDGNLLYQRAIDPNQPEHLGYNPAVAGLNLNYNRVFFEWVKNGSGYNLTMDARARRWRPKVEMSTIELSDRRSPVFAFVEKEDKESWSVAKSALGKKGGRWLPVRRPDRYAGEVFHTILRSMEIDLPAFEQADELPQGLTILAEQHSEPLAPMLQSMLKYSNNLTAEAVGVAASVTRGQDVRRLAQSAGEMVNWAKDTLRLRHAVYRDHSGLSENNRTSAQDLTRVLTQAGWDGPLRPLLKNIPFLDAKGRPIKGEPVTVWAKTGTLNFVSSLAGYVETASGRRLVFSILSADMDKRDSIKRADRERPRGASEWNKRSRILQQKLVKRWADAFDA